MVAFEKHENDITYHRRFNFKPNHDERGLHDIGYRRSEFPGLPLGSPFTKLGLEVILHCNFYAVFNWLIFMISFSRYLEQRRSAAVSKIMLSYGQFNENSTKFDLYRVCL